MYVGSLEMKPTMSESITLSEPDRFTARVVVKVVNRFGDSSLVSEASLLKRDVFPLLV